MKETEEVVPMPSRLLRASTRTPSSPPGMARAIPGQSDDHDLLDEANDDALLNGHGRAGAPVETTKERQLQEHSCRHDEHDEHGAEGDVKRGEIDDGLRAAQWNGRSGRDGNQG
jgi:hypothetical protein